MSRRAFIVLAASLFALIPSSLQAQVTASGKIKMLRVHDVGSGYGPASDRIDVEVVTTLDSQPGKAFGFQLRPDANSVAREAMFDLLRDAYTNNLVVSFDHITPAGKNNGQIIRVWLSR